MEFRRDDSLLSMSVIRSHPEETETPQQYVFTITDGGFAKRTAIEEYRVQSRGGLGIKTMKQDDDRGNLVGGFIVVDGDEVLAIKQSGQVTRSAIDEHLRATSRDTKGVRFVGVGDGDAVAVVARSVESVLDNALDAGDASSSQGEPAETDAFVEGATIDDEPMGDSSGEAPEDAETEEP
jgi:DNA gyrase subunit A